LGNGGRILWVSGRAGEAPAYAGTDFIVARDGRIAALYLFFDKLSAQGDPCGLLDECRRIRIDLGLTAGSLPAAQILVSS